MPAQPQGAPQGVIYLGSQTSSLPICAQWFSVPIEVVSRNRYGDTLLVTVYVHVHAESVEQLTAEIEKIVACGYRVKSFRPDRPNGGYQQQQNGFQPRGYQSNYQSNYQPRGFYNNGGGGYR